MASRWEVNPYVLVRVTGVHGSCWTNNLPYPTQMFHYKAMGELLRMSILVPKRTRRDFLEVLRKYYRVFHVNSVQDMGDGKVMVTVVKNFRDFSVIRVIEELGGIFRANLADSGLETWEFAVTRNRQGEALLRLKELLSMKDFQVMEFRLFKEPKFTESELKVLRKALELGYFDYPRRANSAEVSEALGIDRSTFIYHVRSIQRKLASYIRDRSDIKAS